MGHSTPQEDFEEVKKLNETEILFGFASETPFILPTA